MTKILLQSFNVQNISVADSNNYLIFQFVIIIIITISAKIKSVLSC